MKKIKIFMIVIVMIALLLIIYLFSDTKRINKLILDSYITGTVMEDPIEPLYKFKNENDIMSTNKDAWDKIIILDEHNTIGFIDDFYCADIFKSPRRISRGIEEKIRVVIPQKGENYADSIDKVIDQEKYTHYSPNEKVILENEYYGGNEYYEQQRIRMLRKHENFFSPNSHMFAYRVLTLNYFIKENEQITYLGDMSAEEITKNFDLLMNEFQESIKGGIYRELKEDDNCFYYVFYAYQYTCDLNIRLVFTRYIYTIDKTNGFITENKEFFKADENGLVLTNAYI